MKTIIAICAAMALSGCIALTPMEQCSQAGLSGDELTLCAIQVEEARKTRSLMQYHQMQNWLNQSDFCTPDYVTGGCL